MNHPALRRPAALAGILITTASLASCAGGEAPSSDEYAGRPQTQVPGTQEQIGRAHV